MLLRSFGPSLPSFPFPFPFPLFTTGFVSSICWSQTWSGFRAPHTSQPSSCPNLFGRSFFVPQIFSFPPTLLANFLRCCGSYHYSVDDTISSPPNTDLPDFAGQEELDAAFDNQVSTQLSAFFSTLITSTQGTPYTQAQLSKLACDLAPLIARVRHLEIAAGKFDAVQLALGSLRDLVGNHW